MRLRLLLLAGLCAAIGQARAGLFSDDAARMQVRQVEERVSKLEESGKQQAEVIGQQAEAGKQLAETSRQLDETNKQQIRTMLNLQTQIEEQNTEIRKLRGQNEELRHLLQDAEKRQKDFYIDLDTRIRHFESMEAANAVAPPPSPSVPVPDKTVDAAALAADDIAVENRAYEAAYGLFKAGNYQKAVSAFQEFLKKFPESVYAPKASYELGGAYFALKDYKNALASYQAVAGKYSFSPKAQDAMLGVADCQHELNDVAAARKTLKQIVAKYPGSEIADKARERLSVIK